MRNNGYRLLLTRVTAGAYDFFQKLFYVFFIKISKFWQNDGMKYYKWDKYTQYQFFLV